MKNINHIQLQGTSSFRNKILVENNKITNINPFRDEIFTSNSIFYFVPTALFGGVKSLSTNILSPVGQVKLTLMRLFGVRTDKGRTIHVKANVILKSSNPINPSQDNVTI